MLSLLQTGALVVLVTLGAVGAWLDWRYRRLPNWLCAISFAGGLGFGFALGGPGWLGMSLLHAALALAVGMGLFAAGVIGGGDAKFYAALAAWFPLKFGILLLVAVALAGFVLLLAWLPVRRRFRSAPAGTSAHDDFGKVPYGLAISAGAIATFLIVLPSM